MLKFISVIVAGMSIVSGATIAQPLNLTVAGYSPGGLVSAIGLGMDKALATAYPGSAVTYQTSSGGYANSILLSRDRVPLGLISDSEIPSIWHGKAPMTRKVQNIRLLFRPFAASSRFILSHVIATKKWADANSVKNFADLASGKTMRIAVNRPGNSDADVALSMLKGVGVTPAAIKKSGGQLIRAATKEMKSLILDRRLDLLIVGMSYNHPTVREISNSMDVLMLPVKKVLADSVSKQWAGETCTVKAKEYKFLSANSYNPCMGLGVYVRDSMDEAMAYKITKAMYENADKIRTVHRALQKAVSHASMSMPGIPPHHPGAVRYMKEIGLHKANK